MKVSGVNERMAAQAFSDQAEDFDRVYAPQPMIQYKRERVRTHVLDFLPPGSQMLELNCGTGEDALFFAAQGHFVHATDISAAMVNQLASKLERRDTPAHISYEVCSFSHLQQLKQQGPYDFVFSNFGGLNCTGRLDQVCESIRHLVRPGGYVTLVIISRFCLWESLLMLKGYWKTATRRWFSKQGRTAHVAGSNFFCWYYSPAAVKRYMKGFAMVKEEGLCSLVPPSYMEGFPAKHPRWYARLMHWENKYKNRWPWKSVGDYFIVTFRKVN